MMVGTFPPPVHGMATINEAVRNQCVAAGASVQVIDISADTLSRSLASRIARLPRAVRGVLSLLLSGHQSGDALYMSVSGGLGQLYEIVFVLCARVLGFRLFLHHHCFSYLDSCNPVSRLFFLAAGRSAIHLTLSRHMSRCLSRRYSVRRAVSISNTVFLSSSS